MISLEELERLDTQEKLEDRAEELASHVIKMTADDVDEVYGERAAQDGPEHVYGLAGVKASWTETLLIGRWIAEAKNEILAKLEELHGKD
jgi:hypothetical protein